MFRLKPFAQTQFVWFHLISLLNTLFSYPAFLQHFLHPLANTLSFLGFSSRSPHKDMTLISKFKGCQFLLTSLPPSSSCKQMGRRSEKRTEPKLFRTKRSHFRLELFCDLGYNSCRIIVLVSTFKIAKNVKINAITKSEILIRVSEDNGTVIETHGFSFKARST